MIDNVYSVIATHESAIRALCFFSILSTMLLWEHLRPARISASSGQFKLKLTNFSLAALSTLILRLTPSVLAINIAAQNEQWQLGFSYQLFSNPQSWLVVILCVIALDLCIYIQHRAFHKAPILWKIHQVHHCDTKVNVTTALRFHPLEFMISMAIKSTVVLILGAPLIAVILFEVLLNGFAMFNHSNIRLPKQLERIVRVLFITPTMHRIHHSSSIKQSNTNFGFSTSLWDYLFSTACISNDTKNHKMGVIDVPENESDKLVKLLLLPFQSNKNKERPSNY